MPCWYFERKEIKNSPSFRDGIDTATENRYRREGARFIIDAGTKMGLLYDTCATGVVYFHRFYMFHSFKEFYRYVTAACCLFLAGKVEETPKKCKDIIRIAQSLLSPASFLRFGEDPREEVMTMERILLKTIKFDLQVEHPYGCMLKFAKIFKGDKEKTQKMAQMAWTFINDSLCTTLCLQWEPEIVAVSLMYLASRLTKFEPSDWTGREGSRSKWWEDFIEGMSMELMEDICHQVLDLYSSKQKKTVDGDSPPQSPIKGNRVQSSPPPPPPPAERTLAKRTREESLDVDPPSKISKPDKDVKPASISQNSVSSTSGAPIPVAQHITPSSGNHPSYSTVESEGVIDFSSYNPYISSQMYTSSFMSQEGSQNIQSILAGNAAPPTNVYSDHHVHHSQPIDQPQYPPPLPQTDMTYSYPPPPQTQYTAPPPPLSHPHPYSSISSVSTSTAPPYDPYTVPPNSTPYPSPSYPPPLVSQPPSKHSYPPPPQTYGGFYSPASHSTAPPPRLSNYPSQPPYSSHPQSAAHNYGQSHNQGIYQKHGKHNAGQRNDITALTEVKIAGRSEWNQPK